MTRRQPQSVTPHSYHRASNGNHGQQRTSGVGMGPQQLYRPVRWQDQRMSSVHQQSKQSPQSRGFNNIDYCLYCGEGNHRQQACRYGMPVNCYRCGKEGHKEKFCGSYYWGGGEEGGQPSYMKNIYAGSRNKHCMSHIAGLIPSYVRIVITRIRWYPAHSVRHIVSLPVIMKSLVTEDPYHDRYQGRSIIHSWILYVHHNIS